MPNTMLRLTCLLFISTLLAACSDSSDTRPAPPPRDWSVVELQALQPRPPEAELAVDALALEDGALALLLDPTAVQEPAVRRLSGQVLAATQGLDAATQLRRMVYSLQDSTAPEYLLLADTQANTIAALYDEQPQRSARYLGTDLYQHPTLDLTVAMLPGALFAVGLDATVRDLIETLGDASGTRDTADTEGDTASAAPIQVKMVLPGSDSPRYPLSLQGASELSGEFTVAAQTLEGSLSFSYDQADAYIERFNELATDTATPPLQGDGEQRVALPVSLPLANTADRFAISQLFQGFDGVNYAEQVQVGGNPPWLNFDVGSNPNSIFINFEFASDAQRRAFESSELPAGFKLAPLRILDSDEPTYFLVLNVYQSSGGLVGGARAEWSVFVEDPDTGEPRFLVLQAAAETISADPVNLLTFPEPVSHTLAGGEINSYVGELLADGSQALYFESTFPWPDRDAQLSGFAREFVAANDFIFWGNGVADRGVFNGTVYARQAEIINPDTLTITDNSRWARYLSPTPRHSLIYRNPLEIIISPWWNLQADYLDVTDDFLAELIGFSNAFYPMTALGAAEAAFRGEQSVVRPDDEGVDSASLNVHFRVTDPQGLAAALALLEGTELAFLPLTDGDTEEQFLTLNVFRYADSNCGWQAQWLAYLRDTASDSVSSLRLQALAASPCLDADALLQEAAAVSLAPDNGQWQLQVANLDSRVSAAIDTTTAAQRLPGLAWLQAQDNVCAQPGICDRRFIDGQTLDTPLQEVDPSGVSIDELTVPWSAYIEREPLAVWVSDHPRLIVRNPWYNAAPADTQ